MKRIEWLLKMTLGWMCYWPIISMKRWNSGSRLNMWMLSWAGFYAHDVGFEVWKELDSHANKLNKNRPQSRI